MTFEDASKYLQFASDLITVLLGGITLFAIIVKRKRLLLLFNVILNTHLNHKVRRIRETLTSLENISLTDKDSQKDGVALLGSLIGQIKQFGVTQPRLKEISISLVSMTDGKRPIKQHQMNAHIHEISGILDDLLTSNYSGLFTEGENK